MESYIFRSKHISPEINDNTIRLLLRMNYLTIVITSVMTRNISFKVFLTKEKVKVQNFIWMCLCLWFATHFSLSRTRKTFDVLVYNIASRKKICSYIHTFDVGKPHRIKYSNDSIIQSFLRYHKKYKNISMEDIPLL